MALIFLCGLPGSGKTTVGKLLAQSLKCGFFDLDEEVAASEDKSISEIFADDGEAYFREHETTALHSHLELSDAVIALGAGALEAKGNLRLAEQKGTLIYLQADIEALLDRAIDWQTRPLMQHCTTDEELAECLLELLERRRENYEQADIVIHIETTMTPIDVVGQIERRMEQ